MKYQKKKYNIEIIKKAIYEYKNSDKSGEEIAQKYGITRCALLYHSSKLNNNQNNNQINKNDTKIDYPKSISKKHEALGNWVEKVKTESDINNNNNNNKEESTGLKIIKNRKGDSTINYKDYIKPHKSIFDENI